MGQNHLKGSLLEHSATDERCIQMEKSQQQKVYQILNKLNILLLATSELIPDQKNYTYVWILDTDNSIKNAVASGLLGTKSKIVIKSKGTHKMVQTNSLTAYELKSDIDALIRKTIVPKSHSPLHYKGTKFIYV